MQLWIILLLTYASCIQANLPMHTAETQQKISNLRQKIVLLEKKLSTVNDRQALVNRELHFSDKAIADCALNLRKITHKMTTMQQKIASLSNNNQKLLAEYKTNQKLLARYIVALYHFKPLQLIDIDKKDECIRSANDVHRVVTYYKYLVNNRLSIMESLTINRALVQQQTKSIQATIEKQRHLKLQLVKYEKKLISQKQYQTALINSLIKEYKNNRQELQVAQANKENLENILTRLSKKINASQSVVHVDKFIWPIAINKRNITNIKQGILIQAKEGMPVRAVSSGKVLFSAWLKGYGMLIIIDHGNNIMTLYGHNQALFKKSGDTVDTGEQIAIVGNSGGVLQNGLYFEIRQKGKAVSPVQWLHTV